MGDALWCVVIPGGFLAWVTFIVWANLRSGDRSPEGFSDGSSGSHHSDTFGGGSGGDSGSGSSF
ncbi:hypothetical protein [Catellatospora sp. NPDC049609]|jgi:hypothetical protein|uniref:hypothetical protein n=1 Tax=Catellatospora sp. NPDC049609 TaxID=3155505 RepID=UPI00342F8F06